jgi:exopolysaccharide biosynthesis protein
LCTNNESLLFIAIDGRSEEAEGMNLFEVQKFLQDIGCVDAINLDGGGSTTMWVKGKNVVNSPSDKTGERPVSDALIIITK